MSGFEDGFPYTQEEPEVEVPEHPFGKGLPNPMGVQDEINKAFEPSVFQKEVFAAATLKKNGFVLDTYRLRQRMNRPTYIGIDMAESGADKSIIAQASVDKEGKMFVVFDEYGDFFKYKWYRNPIKWWRMKSAWRKLLKSAKQIRVNIDLDKSVKKEDWML